MAVSFWTLMDCVTSALAQWNSSSGTATKIYNAMNTAKAKGLFTCQLIIPSGNSNQAELTCTSLRQMGYKACMDAWENNQIRIHVTWEP